MFGHFIDIYNQLLKKNNIIFFSEGSNHWSHLEYLLQNLDKEVNILYISLSENDDAKNYLSKNFRFFFINNRFFLSIIFKLINNAIIVTSIPDLGKLYFKKNNKNNKYIYIFHSLASTHVQYKKDAFNHYDIIFCPGEYQYNELTKLKKINNLNFDLVKYGYPRINKIKRYRSHSTRTFNKILIAPSWNNNNDDIYDLYFPLIEQLLKEYSIIFRPHLMSLKDKKLSFDIKEKFYKYKNLCLDTSNNSIKSLIDASILITDWGSTSCDFGFGLNKPTIFINSKKKILNEDYKIISHNALEFDIREYLGVIIEKDNIKNIDKYLIEKIYKNYPKKNFDISKFIYNFDKDLKEIIKKNIIFN